jgi:hypothetical protein
MDAQRAANIFASLFGGAEGFGGMGGAGAGGGGGGPRSRVRMFSRKGSAGPRGMEDIFGNGGGVGSRPAGSGTTGFAWGGAGALSGLCARQLRPCFSPWLQPSWHTHLT